MEWGSGMSARRLHTGVSPSVTPEATIGAAADRRRLRARGERKSARRPGLLGTWPPLPLDSWMHPASTPLPFPLDDSAARLYDRGRHALVAGLRALGLGPGDEALAPAWHHGSEIEALLAAGVTPRFYELRPDLEPDESELEALLGPRTRALHLTHFLGWPRDAARWRRWCDERGLLLIEDAAQAWMARCGDRPAGAHGHLAMFCLYKAVGVPDGAALIVPGRSPAPAAQARSGAKAALRMQAEALAQRSRLAARLVAEEPGEYDQARDIAVGPPDRAPSRATLRLLGRVARPGVPGQRREHARKLIAALGRRVPAPFHAVPDGASPYVVPVTAEDPRALLAWLRPRGIDAVHMWSTPHPAVPAGAFPRTAGRRRTTVALPVHQCLGAGDVDWIAEAMDGAP
jgi:dTDP-4-amino-4,6-dideoxygalactose transaminase